MRKAWIFAVVAAATLSACASGAGARGAASPETIAAAVAYSGRPAADRERDAVRRPDAMLAMARVQPGQRVADLLPGGGYFTRLFSAAVGPNGRVYAVISPQQAANAAQPPAVNAIAADPAFSNVTVLVQPFTALAPPEPVDVVFTAQNYHDLHLARLNLDVAAVNRAIFNAIRPGGYYVIVDHAAVAGAPVSVADSLHRIDQAIVRREVEAAGFVFEEESDAVRNPADPRTQNVFDAAIRGHTDQFVMRFRRP